MSEEKRYNLALPEEMFNRVKEIADAEHTTFLEVLKRFIKLGFKVYDAYIQGKEFIIRDGDKEKEVIIF